MNRVRLRLIRDLLRRARGFAVCVDNGEYAASLELWKIYRVLRDREAAKHGHVRVIDESGEDYLYPREYFEFVSLPPKLSRLHRPHAVA